MIDLKTKQAFWAEQLPIFKEKYWIPEHLDVLEFDMNGGCFDIAEGVKTDLSEEDLFDIYHRVNSGWAMWKKAVSFMREKAQAVSGGYVVVPKIKEVVVAIEKMVEQQVEASGITSEVFRLDGWRILDAIQEASESGAEG
ncbi:hypothetical protein EA716_16720 [Acinetobacter baumannii]|uniref:hypothetical protein n=1 Tax=Acinetobacter baumannii TaxID=470 RepID=UPI000F74833C|nr:hypothetical protein [Acinetobacter baumannii]RSP91869.1 hypothetical protein EA716_16720 [Acinetobacter baumannii]